MRSRLRYLIAGAVAGSLIVPFAAQAAPGDYDRSFGNGGRIFMQNQLADGEGYLELTALPDGRSAVQGTSRCAMSCRAFGVTFRAENGAWQRTDSYPAINDYDGLGIPDRLTGSAVLPDGSVRLGYMGGDPESWGPHDPRGLPATAPAGPFLLAAPPAGQPRSIAALPWQLSPVGGLDDGRTVGWSDGMLASADISGTPSADFGSNGRLAVPPDLGQPGTGSADGMVIRVAGAAAGTLALWRVAPTAGGWSGRVTRVPAHGAGTGFSAVSVAPNGRAIVSQVVGTTPRRYRTIIAGFRPDGTVDRGFGTRGVMRLAGAWVTEVQNNGKVVVASRPNDGVLNPPPFRVARYNADGAVDPSLPHTAIRGAARTTDRTLLSIDHKNRIMFGVSLRPWRGVDGFLLARLRGGEAPALRLASPRRLRPNAVRVVATSSVAGRARIVVRQAGRVVGARNVRFNRGSRQTVTVPLRGARAKRPLAVNGTLKGARAATVRAAAVR